MTATRETLIAMNGDAHDRSYRITAGAALATLELCGDDSALYAAFWSALAKWQDRGAKGNALIRAASADALFSTHPPVIAQRNQTVRA